VILLLYCDRKSFAERIWN